MLDSAWFWLLACIVSAAVAVWLGPWWTYR
jgi:hypothetical protein